MTTAGLSDLIVEVLHRRDDDNQPYWSVGSGFFVGSRLVLTALHNVDSPGELLVRVHGTEEHPAVVRLQGDKDIVDLAVLEISDMTANVPPLRYGKVDRSAPAVVKGCRAVGFPRFKERVHEPKPLRLSAQVDGEIPTGENLDRPLLTLLVKRSPRPLPSGAVRESEWAGISGAAVFSGDNIIVGVITEHYLPEGESALTVVPITAIDLLPEAEATKWWKLLGVDGQALVRLPVQDVLSRLDLHIDLRTESRSQTAEAVTGESHGARVRPSQESWDNESSSWEHELDPPDEASVATFEETTEAETLEQAIASLPPTLLTTDQQDDSTPLTRTSAYTCRVCSSPVKPASRFCGHCGTPQLQVDAVSGRIICPKCGFLNPPELALTGQLATFCDECGEPLFLGRREI